MLAAFMTRQSVSPTAHMRKVRQGMSGSSVFETDARTSGYGESSSRSWIYSGFSSRGKVVVWITCSCVCSEIFSLEAEIPGMLDEPGVGEGWMNESSF